MALPSRQPSKPDIPSFPKPATRPSGAAPARGSSGRRDSRSRRRSPVSPVELAFDQDVADQTPVSGHRVQREDAGAGLLASRAVAVVPAQQLVAAAHGEGDSAARHGLGQRRPAPGQIRRDERLLTVLAAADVEEVGVGGARPQADLVHVEIDAVALRTARRDREVAAIGVDVQVVRIQMREDDSHATRSQYGRVAAVGDHALEAEHRRVRREEHELAAGLGQLEPRSSAASSSGTISILASSRPPYENRSASSARARRRR